MIYIYIRIWTCRVNTHRIQGAMGLPNSLKVGVYRGLYTIRFRVQGLRFGVYVGMYRDM